MEQRLEHRIVDGDRNGIEADLDEAMAGGHTSLVIVNDFMTFASRRSTPAEKTPCSRSSA